MSNYTRIALALVIVLSVISVAGCANPTPEVVKEIVEVTKEVEVVEEVEVTKPVEVTKEVVITPTPGKKGAVTVLGVWGGKEFENFAAAVAPFTEETGIGMAFETSREQTTVLMTRVEAGNPPDVAILPQQGLLAQFAEIGALVPLDSFLDTEQIAEDYAQSWIDLGSHDGTLYGVWFKAALKSLVWYRPDVFEAQGYEVPGTWEEMIALSDQIVADGGTPWCVGLESGAASGWPGTDWVEDIMLRSVGPDVYDQWVNHEIAWTDPAVQGAWDYFGQVARNEDYLWGGTTGALTTPFGDSPKPMFENPPGCYMHRQASFITDFFPEGVTPEDYAIFPFPEIDSAYGVPALGAGDVVVMFNDSPEARAFVEYLATPQPHEIWAAEGGFLSPHRGVSLDAYPDEITRKQADILTSADVFRFDGSDMMPAAVGAGTFWTGIMDYVAGEDLEGVLQTIEASAEDAYGG
jgi:alpha-glucoside transport system substrate-binding protein